MGNDPAALVRFPYFKTPGKQMVGCHSELTILCSSKWSIWQPLLSKCLVRDDVLLDLACLETPIQPTATFWLICICNYYNLIQVIWSTAIEYFEALLAPIDTSTFLSNYVWSNDDKPFSQLNAHVIFYVCYCLNRTCVALLIVAQALLFPDTIDFGRPTRMAGTIKLIRTFKVASTMDSLITHVGNREKSISATYIMFK